MRGRRHKLQVSTFPFLAVLLCAMGSLILVLLVMDRKAHRAAQARAQREAAKLVEETARSESARQAEREKLKEQARKEWEKKRDALHDKLTREQVEMQLQMRKVREELQGIAARLHYEQDTSVQLRRKTQDERSRLQAEEQLLRTLRSNAKQTENQSKESGQALRRMTLDLLQMEQVLKDLKASKLREQKTFSVIPYNGRRGENRRPTYVECSFGGVIFHPERKTMPVEAYLPGSSDPATELRSEVERRIALQHKKLAGQPANVDRRLYLLLLLRPSGIRSYILFQRALRGLPVDFGYEFIDEDWVLDFPADEDAPSSQPWKVAAKTPSRPTPAIAASPSPATTTHPIAGAPIGEPRGISTQSVRGFLSGENGTSGSWVKGEGLKFGSQGGNTSGGTDAGGQRPQENGSGGSVVASTQRLQGNASGGGAFTGMPSPQGNASGSRNVVASTQPLQGYPSGGGAFTGQQSAQGNTPPSVGLGTGSAGSGGGGTGYGRGNGRGHPSALPPILPGDGSGTGYAADGSASGYGGDGSGAGVGFRGFGSGLRRGGAIGGSAPGFGSTMDGSPGGVGSGVTGLGPPRAIASTPGNGYGGSGTTPGGFAEAGSGGNGVPGNGWTGTGTAGSGIPGTAPGMGTPGGERYVIARGNNGGGDAFGQAPFGGGAGTGTGGGVGTGTGGGGGGMGTGASGGGFGTGTGGVAGGSGTGTGSGGIGTGTGGVAGGSGTGTGSGGTGMPGGGGTSSGMPGNYGSGNGGQGTGGGPSGSGLMLEAGGSNGGMGGAAMPAMPGSGGTAPGAQLSDAPVPSGSAQGGLNPNLQGVGGFSQGSGAPSSGTATGMGGMAGGQAAPGAPTQANGGRSGDEVIFIDPLTGKRTAPPRSVPQANDGENDSPQQQTDAAKGKGRVRVVPLTSETSGGGPASGDDGAAARENYAPTPSYAPPSRRLTAPRPAWVHGGRDWTIFVECRAGELVLYPSQRTFPLAQVIRDPAGNSLVKAIRQMIDRKQSSRRSGEPPFHPQVCLLVRPEHIRTFLTVYPALDALPVPKTRRNLDADDDVIGIVTGAVP